jgi:benzoyl-CoA reductase/2-hydroxyglutaryl-CoA dehydratase subunit BcrC/BadD/HgdB
VESLLSDKEGAAAVGKPVMGCFPLYPPLELFHCMGFEPVVMWGLEGGPAGTRDADRHVQSYACSVARRLAQHVIEECRALDGLFFYNACDTLRNLPEILAAACLEKGAAPLPLYRLHVPMTPTSQADASGYLEQQVWSLVEALEEASGELFTDEAFASSVDTYRAHRSACVELEAALAQGRLTFTRFCEVMGQADLVGVEVHTALLKETIAGAPGAGPVTGTGRVLLSGILPPPPNVARLFDEAGLTVAANDLASCHRANARTPERWGDVADYYVRFYRDHFPCSTLLFTADDRPDELLDLARSARAQGIVFVGEKFCEYEYLEMPFLEDRFEEAGLPSLLVEISIEEDAGEAARTRLQAFSEMLAGRGTGETADGA